MMTENTAGCNERPAGTCLGALKFSDKDGKQFCMLHYSAADKTDALREYLKIHADGDVMTFREGWFFADTFPSIDYAAKLVFLDCHFEGSFLLPECKFLKGMEARNTQFEREVSFKKGWFNNVYFSDCTFSRSFSLQDASISGRLALENCNFGQDTLIDETDFSNLRVGLAWDCRNSVFKCRFTAFRVAVGREQSEPNPIISECKQPLDNFCVLFEKVRFEGRLSFVESKFFGPAEFRSLTFAGQTAAFYKSWFGASLSVVDSDFACGADFEAFSVEGDTTFDTLKFGSTLNMREASIASTSERGISFTRTTVSDDADFTLVRFGHPGAQSNVDFGGTTFEKSVTFDDAKFSGSVAFKSVTFKAMVHMQPITCNGILDFADAIFFAHFRIGRSDAEHLLMSEAALLPFHACLFQKPDFISFQSTRLLARWFIDVDVRKFEFENVDLVAEIDDDFRWIDGKKRITPRLLAATYRRLATNAEENHRYDEASKFRYRAMEVRLRDKSQSLSPLLWCYKQASGYGEKVSRAILVLMLIVLLGTLSFTAVPFERSPGADGKHLVAKPLHAGRAFVYSLQVMTLQKPDQRPADVAGQGIVALLAIVGPLQAALLALAVRRQFMR